MMFSERYSELITQENNQLKDNICGEIDYQIKIKIADVMRCFAQPQIVHPNRYDNYEVNTTALDIAVGIFNDRKGIPYIRLDNCTFGGPGYDSLASVITPFLFDVIELQYEELSDDEQSAFQKELNSLLNENNVPWLLHDGVMIKIDSLQFEQDLRNKALANMEELKDADSRFAPAYSELLKSFEFYEKQEYGEAINNAEKSYESILKVIGGTDKGSADKLTKQLVETSYLKIPESMNAGGFQNNVLMSLPFMRNNSSSAHGSGETATSISKEFAHLALNFAAALDTFLVEAYKEKETSKEA